VIAPPASESELMARARALAGRTLGELAAELGEVAPPDMTRHKGWIGNLFEHALGATAASRDEPDFPALGVELKSLPVDGGGRPVETTFVCTIPLWEIEATPWERSRVRRKLARVLWVPFEGERARAVAERRIGAAFVWSPNPAEEADLRADWEELGGIIGRGGIESLTARLGRWLQVRPKAAHGRVRRRAIDDEGNVTGTLPRGFYLRTSFTARLIREHLVVAR
jgi:DNA mismatch repair protein MutH